MFVNKEIQMGKSLAYKLIESHLVEGQMQVGTEIGLKIDQTLTQDATGTMVMLECEAMNLIQTKADVSVQYIDHNLIQEDFKNPDDHLFLRSACRKYGVWFSRPGNGVSHPVHMERFGIPGKTLLGSDSHSCAAGSLGMLAMGAGGLEVAMAIAGRPYHVTMPAVLGVRLTGELPDWVSAKDIILEMLRRHGVSGGLGKIIEYFGPGLKQLTAMDRHVIANMGAELGATATVFPADEQVKLFLKTQSRVEDFVSLKADDDVIYDVQDEIDLSSLVPLIALPTSPSNVVPVTEVAGKEIYQAMIGSSANPGLRDFAIPAMIVDGKITHDRVSFDINPTSRQILENLINLGLLQKLIHAGGRIHQPGCNGCIGMGQAPATNKISLRTVPRNFPGRSGTKEDLVYLCSPETAAASAITGVITDPRSLDMAYPKFKEPKKIILNKQMLVSPPSDGSQEKLEKGPNIKSLPKFASLDEVLQGPVLLKVGDDISTDTIMPAGAKVLPYRSNIPAISRFVYAQLDESYFDRAMKYQQKGSFIVGGENYGQGSSREHAAIAPRYLGLRVVLAKSFARIHAQNLINFGVLPLLFIKTSDYDEIDQQDELKIEHAPSAIQSGNPIPVLNVTKNKIFDVKHFMSERQVKIMLAGSLINTVKH